MDVNVFVLTYRNEALARLDTLGVFETIQLAMDHAVKHSFPTLRWEKAYTFRWRGGFDTPTMGTFWPYAIEMVQFHPAR